MEHKQVWDIVTLPQGQKSVKSMWVFKVKEDNNGKVQDYKARPVAKGCSQSFGVNINETYSPVNRLTHN